MRARLFTNILRAGSVARDYLRLVESRRHRTSTGMDDPNSREAQKILESFQDANKPEYELDINISGDDLIHLLDRDFEQVGLIPYYFSDAARLAGEAISEGSRVIIFADDRTFTVVRIVRQSGAVCIKDSDDSEYVVPWNLVRPYSNHEV